MGDDDELYEPDPLPTSEEDIAAAVKRSDAALSRTTEARLVAYDAAKSLAGRRARIKRMSWNDLLREARRVWRR